MAEYSSSGIWAMGDVHGPFRHGMVEHATLRLPPDLARRFDEWVERYEALDDAGTPAFNQAGLQLATELKRFLGRGAHVEFAAEASGGGLGETITIP